MASIDNEPSKIKTYEEYILVKEEKLQAAQLLADSNAKNDKERAIIFQYLDSIFACLPEKEKLKSESYVFFLKRKKEKKNE